MLQMKKKIIENKVKINFFAKIDNNPSDNIYIMSYLFKIRSFKKNIYYNQFTCQQSQTFYWTHNMYV